MRDRILDAAERLLARLGYEKTTMDEMAREAGIGKRTIYLHFPSKEEVALSTIDRIGLRLRERLRSIAASRDSAAERLQEMLLTRILFRFDSVRNYYQNLDEMFRAIRSAFVVRRGRCLDEETNIFAEVLIEGRAAGEFAFDDPCGTARILLMATDSLLPSNLNRYEMSEVGERRDVEVKTFEIARMLLFGLVPRDTTDPMPPPPHLHPLEQRQCQSDENRSV